MTDLAIASDLSRLVIIGLEYLPIPPTSKPTSQQDQSNSGGAGASQQYANTKENRLIIYDYASKKQEAYVSAAFFLGEYLLVLVSCFLNAISFPPFS